MRSRKTRNPYRLKMHLSVNSRPLCGGGRNGKAGAWIEHFGFANLSATELCNCKRCIKVYINILNTGTKHA